MVNRLQTIVYDSINVVHILAWHTTYTISEVNLYDFSEIECLYVILICHFMSFQVIWKSNWKWLPQFIKMLIII